MKYLEKRLLLVRLGAQSLWCAKRARLGFGSCGGGARINLATPYWSITQHYVTPYVCVTTEAIPQTRVCFNTDVVRKMRTTKDNRIT